MAKESSQNLSNGSGNDAAGFETGICYSFI
jgi:hypothetical protein